MFNIVAILDFKRKTHYHTDKHTNMTSAWKFLHLVEGIWSRRTTRVKVRQIAWQSLHMESRIWIFQPVVNESSVVILRPAKHIDTVIKDSKPSRSFKWQFIRWTILSKHTPSTWFTMINFDILCQVRMLFLMSFSISSRPLRADQSFRVQNCLWIASKQPGSVTSSRTSGPLSLWTMWNPSNSVICKLINYQAFM